MIALPALKFILNFNQKQNGTVTLKVYFYFKI